MAVLNQAKSEEKLAKNITYAIICEERQNSGMSFSQKEYVNKYNKDNYKTFLFRVRKDDNIVIKKLNAVKSINKYVVDLVKEDADPEILTIKQIKERTLPVFQKHKIKEVYLFGSYARGEATRESDVDLYFESGDVESLLDHSGIMIELKEALGKDVDTILFGSELRPLFKEQLDLDKIKLW